MNDTIAAISSSGGPIGLIRVSGERAIEAINAVFQAKNGKPLTEAPSQKLVYRTLTDKSGNVIDCCYAVALHAPHTYTAAVPRLDSRAVCRPGRSVRAGRAAGRGR